MDWKTNTTYRFWRVLSVSPLDEYKSQTIHLQHESGFEVFHVANDNPENLFAYAFKTLPQDNTGVAHILEHTVLCGSEKYPVKDPFLNLIKSSLNTFLNAFTFPDKTVYTASSAVPADFFNLMRVYSDAVFHPLLKPSAFAQEGWHFKKTDENELEVSGIVYNEMKGAYSSSESIMQEMTVHSLFDKSIYRHDSGGNPDNIPSLTYEQFVDFHHTFYHPSHTRLFLFGNIKTEDHLDFIEKEVLSRPVGFPVKEIPALPAETRWTEPRFGTLQVPPPEDSQLPSTIISWLMMDISNAQDVLGLEILTQILLSDASPLVLKLLAEGYGEDLSPLSGYESELRDTLFSVGMRGIPEDKKDKLYAFIMSTLKEMAETGLDHELVEGILFSFDFAMREIKGSGQGLRLMRRTLRGWIHGLDPRDTLVFAEHLNVIKSQWRNGRFFENLIDKYLLNNPHHTCLIFESDETYEEKHQAKFNAWIDEKTKEWLPARSTELEKLTADLTVFQGEMDSLEALATLPILKKEQVPREIRKTLPFSVSPFGETILGVDAKTNGIVYINLYFSLSSIPANLFPALGLFHRAWDSLGTKNYSQEDLDKQIRLNFGHFFFGLHHEVDINGDPQPWLSLLIATTTEKRESAFALTKEILFNADWDNSKRLKELLLEIKNDFASSLTGSGHQYAELLALSELDPSFALKESISGVSGYQYWQEHSKDLEKASEWLSETFKQLQALVLNQMTIKSFVVAENDETREAWQKDLSELIGSFSSEKQNVQNYQAKPSSDAVSAVILKTKVNFNAEAFKGFKLLDKDYPTAVFISHFLKSHHLWQKVRMQGGAYGAGSNAYGMGYFTFSSYRDPHTQKTLDAFKESLSEIAGTVLSEEEVYTTLIGMLGSDLAPITPSAHSIISFKLRERGITDEMRQKVRDGYFSLSGDDVVRVAKTLLQNQETAKITSLTSDALLEKEGFTGSVEKIQL